MTIKEKIIEHINNRFYKHVLGDFNEQSIYNFITNYLHHHGYKLPNNFDFIIEDNGIFYDIKPMNNESEEFMNQKFNSIL